MRRRTFLSAAGLGALGLTAASCGTSNSSSGGTSTGGTSSAPSAAALSGTGAFTYVQGKDNNGYVPKQVATWNAANPNEKCTLIELSPQADQQRQSMIQNFIAKADTYGVLSVDVVWTAEFAANQYIVQLDQADFPASDYLAATATTGTYFNKLYAAPTTSDGALLYYRKDLLEAAGVSAVPTTWKGVVDAIDKVKSSSAANAKIGGYVGQLQKYEGLTCNFSEVVNSSGGSVLDDKNQPTVDTADAKEGLAFLVDGFKQGYIPKAAITYQEEESRNAFQSGQAIFMRNWPYCYSLMSATDGSSKVAGKFGITTIPGKSGPGVSTLGGHNLAISSYAKNKASCLKFVKFLSGEGQQRFSIINASAAPTIGKLYDDPALVAKFPYLPVLKKSIEGARKRPAAVKYNDVSTAMQSAAYSAMQGNVTVDAALSGLETQLQGLLKTS